MHKIGLHTLVQAKLLRSLILCLTLSGFCGCGIIDMVYLPPAEDTAQEIYEAANDAMAEKNYVRAVELYNKLRDAYPFCPYITDAELALADAYFLDGEYDKAHEAYKDFESLHPRHAAIEYVLYQLGQSKQKQFMSIDRPTTELAEACAYYERLLQQYPSTRYADAARKNILECRKQMAEHELYIGNMFMHMDKPGPAWHRYTYICENFKDVPEVVELASGKATEAYIEYTEQANEERRAEREGSWKTWFKWL
ncbi:MAG: outer membrane protein assembly factor BamD [Desulfovibrionaceae bacterium]|nr:outer membrane protein assembly factor BamD [Desulfovibrionaceae bacterium]